MLFEFSRIELPEIPNNLRGPRYERLKKTIVAVLFTQRAATFMRESSASGAWQPLSNIQYSRRLAKVSKKKRNQQGAVKILQDTGLLRQSFTDAPGPGNVFRESSTEGDEVSIQTNVEYAKIQNDGGVIMHPGTKNGFNKGITIAPHLITIPARPFDQFTTDDKKELNELMEQFLNG